MGKRRYLAPWHREVVDMRGRGGAEEGDLAEVLAGLRGKPAIYHCVSRVVNREFVLKREEREKFVALMRAYERFCQVRVLTFCVLSNHFHILLEVPAAPEDGGGTWTDTELLAHMSQLYSERQMGELRWELEYYRENKMEEAAEAFRRRIFARMWDLSSYMKLLKQCFAQWFNKKHGREGYLWGNRFKSVLVEDGHAARRVASYIDLNPVRAGIVEDPKDYRWSGYGEAVAGKGAARDGLRLVLFEKLSGLMGGEQAAAEVASWREVIRRYRVILFEDGEDRAGEAASSGHQAASGRRGISRQAVARVLAEDGELSEAMLGMCRARHLVDGLVLGTEEFVNLTYSFSWKYFGAARRSGARKLRGVRTVLRTMRDLQKEPVSIQLRDLSE